MPSLAGIRRRQPRATPAAITDPSIGQIVPNAIGQFGGAVAQAGAGIGRLIERRNTELAKADFEGMKADTAGARNEFLRSLRTTDLDYNGINKAWSDFKRKNFKTIGNTTKQRKAQKAYGMYIRGVIPQWDRDVDNIAWGLSADRAKVKVFNSAVSQLQTNPVFNEGLILANDTIEGSSLLTSEQKDLALANAVIETNPQWYLDNVDAEGTKELFALLSSDQKNALDNKARSNISRIRADQQQANKILNDETRKTAADLLRENELTDTWLQANRPNMAASDYERYNNHLISQAEAQKKFQTNLEKIKDPFNREIFGKLDAANTAAELDELKRTVNQYVSPQQKKLSVEEAKKWTGEINEKLENMIVTEAKGFAVWSALNDKITVVQANSTRENINALNKEIDEAVIAAPGEQALITVSQGTKLQTRLAGIEKDPATKKRPSLTRAHSGLARLRKQEISILPTPREKEDLPKIVAIENRYTRLGEELDAYADTIAVDKDFDAKINTKFEELIRPVVEEVTLGWWEGWFRRGAELTSEKIDTLKEQDVFDNFTEAEQDRAIALIEAGATVENAIREIQKSTEVPKRKPNETITEFLERTGL